MSLLSPLSSKLALLSTFLVFFTAAFAFKFSVPDFFASDVPIFWNVLLQWLKPPYLYLIINGIIISIVASSKLQHHKNEEYSKLESDYVYDRRSASFSVVDDEQSRGGDDDDVRDLSVKTEDVKKNNVDDEDTSIATAETTAVKRTDSMEFIERWFEKQSEKQREKPPVSSRFNQKKSVKNISEGGKALRVAKPKRNDTLESTWKKITEGRAMPLTRHLKKSDTWETHVRHNDTPLADTTMKKSETFHERNSALDGGLRREPSLRLKKEPSLSQDELNKRVEAFIKKFNEEMRMQRQRSIDQYNEMIRRGV